MRHGRRCGYGAARGFDCAVLFECGQHLLKPVGHSFAGFLKGVLYGLLPFLRVLFAGAPIRLRILLICCVLSLYGFDNERINEILNKSDSNVLQLL